MADYLTAWSAQEISLMAFRLLAWVNDIEDPTGFRVDDVAYIEIILLCGKPAIKRCD